VIVEAHRDIASVPPLRFVVVHHGSNPRAWERCQTFISQAMHPLQAGSTLDISAAPSLPSLLRGLEHTLVHHGC
jgi:hypothetical protein